MSDAFILLYIWFGLCCLVAAYYRRLSLLFGGAGAVLYVESLYLEGSVATEFTLTMLQILAGLCLILAPLLLLRSLKRAGYAIGPRKWDTGWRRASA